jgi:hypothetical protein
MVWIVGGLALVVLCVGCATAEKGRWTFDKAGVSEAVAKKDRSQCFAVSIEGTQTVTNVGLFKPDREAYKACMERRGYTLRVAP